MLGSHPYRESFQNSLRRKIRMRAGTLSVLISCIAPHTVMGVTSTVTTEADLRAAIQNAAVDTIAFNCGGGAPCTITLTSSLPPITRNLTINGAGTGGNSVIDGAGQFRVFFVDSGTVAINNLTIRNAVARGGHGGGPGG